MTEETPQNTLTPKWAKNAGFRRRPRRDAQVDGWVSRLEDIQDGVELVGLRARRTHREVMGVNFETAH